MPVLEPPAVGKDPGRIRRGRAGMRARWAGHTPRIVSLASLTDPQKRLVMALIHAAREEAASGVETEAAMSTEGKTDATATV